MSFFKIIIPLLLVFSTPGVLGAQQQSKHPTNIYLSYSGFNSEKNMDIESVKMSLETFLFNTLLFSGGLSGFSTINELEEIQRGKIIGSYLKGVVYELKVGARVPVARFNDIIGFYSQKRMDADYGAVSVTGKSRGLGLLSRNRINQYLDLYLGGVWAFEKEAFTANARKTFARDYDLTVAVLFNTAENLAVFTEGAVSPSGEVYSLGIAISF